MSTRPQKSGSTPPPRRCRFEEAGCCREREDPSSTSPCAGRGRSRREAATPGEGQGTTFDTSKVSQAERGPSPQPSKSELCSSRPRKERGEGAKAARWVLVTRLRVPPLLLWNTGSPAFAGDDACEERHRAAVAVVVIPGRSKASNPESRDSPMCNCTSEVRVVDAPRNDGVNHRVPKTQ